MLDEVQKKNQQDYQTHLQEQKESKNRVNPWERVFENVDINKLGDGPDISRMKEAMIARKSDITKRGGFKKAL